MDGYTLVMYLLQLMWLALCTAGKGGAEFFLNADAFSTQQVLTTSERLSRLMHLQCLPDRIVITFRREVMLDMGILPGQVSFHDSRCTFISNSTHYKYKILFRGTMCASMHDVDPATMIHTINNSVIFSPPIDYRDANLLSLDDEDRYGSGSGNGEVAEDIELHIINIPFICTYTSPSPETTTASHSQVIQERQRLGSNLPKKNSSFIMELFDEDLLLNPLQQTYEVSIGTTLYVQVKPEKDSSYEKAFLHNCYYTEHEMHNTPTAYLIRNGCPIDPSVTFHEDSKKQGVRMFSFRVHKLTGMQTSLQCELKPCWIEDTVKGNIPQCGSQMSYCASKRTGVDDTLLVTWSHALIFTGTSTAQQDLPGCVQQTVDRSCDCKQVDGEKKSNDMTMEVQLWVVILIAIAAFAIGCLSMAAVWCIKTDSKHDMISVPTEPQSNDSHPSVHCKLMNSSPTTVT